MAVESGVISASTEALQAMERLYLDVKKHKQDYAEGVFDKCVDCLDNLRSVKSTVEGSDINITAPEVNESCLLELKQLTLMHIPSSITDEARQKFQDLVHKLFEGQDVKVLYATLLTCPWYSCTQKERGEQAKHNVIFVVYKSTLDRFLSPVNSHLVEQTNVVDKGWLYASELYHFVQFISKARTRNVEALFCPNSAIVYQTEEWKKLREQLHHSKVMGLRSFIEACRGQSIGGIGKKGKDGVFRLKDSTTFRELCDSYRLMHHAHNITASLPPCTEEFTDEGLPNTAREAVQVLRSMYQNPDVSKKDAFSILVNWGAQVNHDLKDFKFVQPEEVQSIVGSWHMAIRLDGWVIRPPASIPDNYTNLLQLMETIGGPVTSLEPDQIIMITQAGSFMYGLSTPTSDVDYLVIYADKTEKVLTACKRLPESFENRGKTKQIEYGAYEVRCFSEMLLKGSVVILELVFKDGHNYTSPAWNRLAKHKDMFLTERGIQQYMGLIKNNFKMIESEKHKDTPQERKLFYQIYHKLDSLKYFLERKPPPVKCGGLVRDYIMRIRTEPLEEELQRDNLYKDAKVKFDQMKIDLANRKTRLNENVNFKFMVDWIMYVRGLSGDQT